MRRIGGTLIETARFRTISLGINPNKGGRPPSDKRAEANRSLVDEEIDVEDDKSLGVSIFMLCIMSMSRARCRI